KLADVRDSGLSIVKVGRLSEIRAQALRRAGRRDQAIRKGIVDLVGGCAPGIQRGNIRRRLREAELVPKEGRILIKRSVPAAQDGLLRQPVSGADAERNIVP